MKLAILTSTECRHRYYANRLGEAFDVVAVGYEHMDYKHYQITDDSLSTDDYRIVCEYFGAREIAEHRTLGASMPIFDRQKTRAIMPRELHQIPVHEWLKRAGADTVAVFGTSLIKPPLLDLCPGRMINMHLGLSPYYRGTATNFYPLLNGEPEYVGATIHLLDEGIDSGPIFRHARPKIVAGDTPHTIGCKAIKAGTDAMIQVLRDHDRLGVRQDVAVAQWKVPNARLYLRKDYHPRQVVELHKKFDGMMDRYLKEDRKAPSLVRCNDDDGTG
jgi:folate-dependent phosphoribosylglycinamide formyltransferase PurN